METKLSSTYKFDINFELPIALADASEGKVAVRVWYEGSSGTPPSVINMSANFNQVGYPGMGETVSVQRSHMPDGTVNPVPGILPLGPTVEGKISTIITGLYENYLDPQAYLDIVEI